MAAKGGYDGMNELLILGILLVIFTVTCAAEELVAHRHAIAVWLDRKLTPIHAARLAYRRAKKIKF